MAVCFGDGSIAAITGSIRIEIHSNWREIGDLPIINLDPLF
jgi:hypothetical protein